MFHTQRSLLRVLEREAAERKLLIDQIMHLSNRTWTPPPRDTEYPTEPVDPEADAWVEAA